ncbi:MAG TPA: DUF2891 domain-containing protein [Steroidobacteraceae bacterium]|nr:DUF2891 domain-containing protein [Steroidobacteraceae bacterium]
MRTLLILVALVSISACGEAPAPAMPSLDARAAGRFARLALACVHLEYPNKISHVLGSDADLHPPRKLTPVFYGCFDWHSAVHGHWLLARLARLYPESDFASTARAALDASFTGPRVAAELVYLRGAGRVSFERPYGLAWLLQLAAELRNWPDADAQRWAEMLRPLETEAADRIRNWLPKLRYPIRVGEHSQTAFAFGLIRDWSVAAGDVAMQALIDERSRAYYLADVDCPLQYEPSGEDFLSPCLAEADLMRRVLAPEEYSGWLARFLRRIPRDSGGDWLEPGVVTDRADPKLAHLDGLNLSRAWMLLGIAAGLPESDTRRASLIASANRHADSALPAVTGAHYEGGHWLGSFAVYLLGGSGRGAGAAGQ